MTIPTQRQQVATHPAKDAVTAPVIKEKKDADVNRKLKLYGVRPPAFLPPQPLSPLCLAGFSLTDGLPSPSLAACPHRSSRPSARARSRPTSRSTRPCSTPRRPPPLTFVPFDVLDPVAFFACS